MSDKTRRIAIITDSLSREFYFSRWYQYYSNQFGSSNIYVVTYSGFQQHFYSLSLGGIWEIPALYDDSKRAATITALVRTLLEHYHYVIRVDADEFIVPDPRMHSSLRQYMDTLDRPYVTAMGFDVIHDSNDETLDLSEDILVKQRQRCYAFTALNKTCVTSIPITWLRGFHYCSIFPEFNQLFLFHLKRADIAQQIAWSNFMATQIVEDPKVQEYYAKDGERINAYMARVRQLPRVSGWEGFDRLEFNANFLAAVKFYLIKGRNNGEVYHGPEFVHDSVLAEVPLQFRGVF